MRHKLNRPSLKWHLPKWCADVPTPMKRSINMHEMSKDDLHQLHWFLVKHMNRWRGIKPARHNFVWDLLYDINVVLGMSNLERLALAAGN